MKTSPHARAGLAILSRATAAIVGGYVLVSALAVALAAVWAFAPVPLAQVWAWLLGLGALCLALAWVGG